MKKYAKKLLALAMVLAMVLSLSVSAMALTDPDGTYTQVDLDTSAVPQISGEATVYLSIVSDRVYDNNGNYAQIERYNLPVTVGETGVTATYYVSDVLLAARNQYSWLDYYTANGTRVQDHFYSVYGVKDTSVSNTIIFQPAEYDYMEVDDWFDEDDAIFAYLQYCCNGWMFRINDQIPLLNAADWPANPTQSEYGALITEAYVVNGDHVFLYFADTYEAENYDEEYVYYYDDVYATQYLKLDNILYDDQAETISVDLYASKVVTNHYSMQWDLSEVDYVPYEGLADEDFPSVGV